MSTFRLLSALLCYPEQELIDALPSLVAMETTPELQCFMRELGAMDLLDAQERYVALFDRNRSLSLHLYEHVHGESRIDSDRCFRCKRHHAWSGR